MCTLYVNETFNQIGNVHFTQIKIVNGISLYIHYTLPIYFSSTYIFTRFSKETVVCCHFCISKQKQTNKTNMSLLLFGKYLLSVQTMWNQGAIFFLFCEPLSGLASS